MNEQEYELTANQAEQSEQPINQTSQMFTNSAKLTSTAKGIRIDVHCYGNSSEGVRQQLLKTYLGIESDLRNNCITIVPMNEGK